MLYGSDVAPRINDYGIIGDCRSAALISRHGSLDWLCWPWFDSPSLFAAILDTEKGGFWRIAPAGAYSATRRYLPGTNVLETEFHTKTGKLRVLDCMPVYDMAYEQQHMLPDREVLRIVECTEGEVQLDGVYAPAPKYGKCSCRWTHSRALGIRVEFRGGAVWFRSDLDWHFHDHHALCNEVLRAGQRKYCSMVFMEHGPAVLSPLGEWSDASLDQTVGWWKRWSDRCVYKGPFREQVVRSALALKLLNFAPSGAIVAAPTASLPERVGGDLNWDYRYCWLRDASLTLGAIMDLGYHTEGDAFLGWLLHTTRLSRPRLQVLYDVYGETEITESSLDHLEGYCGSRPVRIGNGAHEQLQLDAYGSVILAAYDYVKHGGELDVDEARFLRGLGEAVCELWRLPDHGIWEIRGGPQHNTYSKLMCWVALDRLLRLHAGGKIRIPAERFAAEREAIVQAIETRGYNEELGAYSAFFDAAVPDASLLLMSRYNYKPTHDPRLRATFACIERALGHGDLLYRYPIGADRLPGQEGAFVISSFWAVDYLIRAGQAELAQQRFERLLARANDVGLYSEEIEPESGAALGNFPQAFSHVGLIIAALSLADVERVARDAA